MDDKLLEPQKAYAEEYENAFRENAQARLDALIAQSGVDAEANRKTVEELRKEKADSNVFGNRAKKQRGLRTFLIVLTVIAFAVAGIGALQLTDGKVLAGVLMIVLGALCGIGFILLIALAINPRIRNNSSARAEHDAKAEALLKEAWRQMRPLNNLFSSDDTRQLIEKTVPAFKIDRRFDMPRFDCMTNKYGMPACDDDHSSTVEVLSGTFMENPFVIDRQFRQEEGVKRYDGALEIEWQTSSTDYNGNVRYQTHTQTLHASVTKPVPVYNRYTTLIFGSDAAPDLCFTHDPSHAERLSDAEYEKTVKKGAKEIHKLQEKAVKHGNAGFTEMGNEAFDVLFGALDRDNEVQFRLLFTPLAQKNMLALMRSKVGYGDDFRFVKVRGGNMIKATHAEEWDMDTTYTQYASYDYDVIIERYMSFNRAYFKHFFFLFAPLLSVPLYQQMQPTPYAYAKSYERNYTDFETECAINLFDESAFRHPDAETPCVLKTELLHKDGDVDTVSVTAHAYRTEERVDYVPVRGGDGEMHDVPVPWIEYIHAPNVTRVKLKAVPVDEKTFKETDYGDRLGDCVYSHGILACIADANGEGFETAVGELFPDA